MPKTLSTGIRATWTERLLVAALPALMLALLLITSVACERAPSTDDLRALQQRGRFAATIEPLREHIKKNPDDSEAHYLYGVALGRTGASRVAVWSLRKAAESPEWMIPATLELATAAAQTGNWQSSIEAANRVLEADPENLTARIIRGKVYLGKGQEPELALEDFEWVLDHEPKNVAALTSRAAAMLMAGHADEAAEALAELESVVKETSPNPSTAAQLCATQAVLQAERGERNHAEERFVACLDAYPTHAVLVEPAISFFDQTGQEERSTQILENALALVPESQNYRRMLSQRAAARGDLEAAEATLREGVELEEPHFQAAAWTDLTNFYLERDDLPAAIEAYEHALALAEDPPQLAILSHADMLARAGRHERALEVAETLESEAYRGLIEARVHLNERRPAQALARLDEVLPTWPNNAGARYYAARAAEQMGDFKRAIEEYRQSLRSAPGQTEAALRLAKLYLGAGSFQNAWNAGGQYLRAHPDDPEGVRVILRSAATSTPDNLRAFYKRLRPSPLWPVVLATRAETISAREGPAAAVAMIEEAKGVDLTRPLNADLLRAKTVNLLAIDRADEARAAVDAALVADPESGAFQEIHAVVLEHEGASVADVRAAYQRAIEIDPDNWQALEALGRLSEGEGATDRALDFYDRATLAYPEGPSAARHAAQLAQRTGPAEQAESRWEALLREHPWDAVAAAELAKMRLTRGVSDDSVLELAERAVLFRGGIEAQKLLMRVHETRGDGDRAAEVARAIETGDPIPPRKVTSIDEV